MPGCRCASPRLASQKEREIPKQAVVTDYCGTGKDVDEYSLVWQKLIWKWFKGWMVEWATWVLCGQKSRWRSLMRTRTEGRRRVWWCKRSTYDWGLHTRRLARVTLEVLSCSWHLPSWMRSGRRSQRITSFFKREWNASTTKAAGDTEGKVNVRVRRDKYRALLCQSVLAWLIHFLLWEWLLRAQPSEERIDKTLKVSAGLAL